LGVEVGEDRTQIRFDDEEKFHSYTAIVILHPAPSRAQHVRDFYLRSVDTQGTNQVLCKPVFEKLACRAD